MPAIEAHGGEVLKFVGDGLLGIFPVADRSGGRLPRRARRRGATPGPRSAQTNAERAERGEPRLRYGLALHLGEVLYGNIGSAGRLDFTTIGPAVNLTARLETLARDLGRDLVASAAFAGQLSRSPDLARPLRAARLSRAPGGVRPGGPVSVADALIPVPQDSPSRGAPAARQAGRAVQAQSSGPSAPGITPRSGAG